MGTNHIVDHWMADPSWQLDCHTIDQFLRRPADPLCHHSLERRLRPECVPNGPDVLVCNAGTNSQSSNAFGIVHTADGYEAFQPFTMTDPDDWFVSFLKR